jgi:hypothetical protein
MVRYMKLFKASLIALSATALMYCAEDSATSPATLKVGEKVQNAAGVAVTAAIVKDLGNGTSEVTYIDGTGTAKIIVDNTTWIEIPGASSGDTDGTTTGGNGGTTGTDAQGNTDTTKVGSSSETTASSSSEEASGSTAIVFDDLSIYHATDGGISEGEVIGLWFADADVTSGGATTVTDLKQQDLINGDSEDSTKWGGWNFSEGNAYQDGALAVEINISRFASDDTAQAWDAWAAGTIGYKFKLRSEGGDWARRTDGSSIGDPGQLEFDDFLCLDMEYSGAYRQGVSYLRVDFDETKRFPDYENIFDNANVALYNPGRYDIPKSAVYGGRATVKIPIQNVYYPDWDANVPADGWLEPNAQDVFRIMINRVSAPAAENGDITDAGIETLKIHKISKTKKDC